MNAESQRSIESLQKLIEMIKKFINFEDEFS